MSAKANVSRTSTGRLRGAIVVIVIGALVASVLSIWAAPDASAGGAPLLQQSHTATIQAPPGETTQPFLIPQLDPATTSLVFVSIEAQTPSNYVVQVENLGGGPVVEAQYSGSIRTGAMLRHPGLNDLLALNSFSGVNLSGYDGFTDFGGASGRLVVNFADLDPYEITFGVHSAGFQDFVGSGEVPGLACFSHRTDDLVPPAGVLIGQRTTSARCSITVTYTYVAVATPSCNGELATVNLAVMVPSMLGFEGTSGPDVIVGTSAPERIHGLEGDDLICGGGGDDEIRGGEGSDTIFAEDGDDVVYGADGNDIIDGGPGADFLYGNDGQDRVFGRQGADQIDGGADDDVLHGNLGNDRIDGFTGDDRIFGYAGDDTIVGGDGNDRLHGNFGHDEIEGGSGDDRIFGYGDNDVLRGGEGQDLIGGNFGVDSIFGDDGNDTLYGSDGNDTVDGGAGNDSVAGNSGNDQVLGGPGNDELDGGINADVCNGGSGTDTATRCETVVSIP